MMPNRPVVRGHRCKHGNDRLTCYVCNKVCAARMQAPLAKVLGLRPHAETAAWPGSTAGRQETLVASALEQGGLILKPAVLRNLTGYTKASAQIRWLRRSGWKFVVNSRGIPVVAHAEFNRHLVGGKTAKNQQPNYEGIID